EPWVGRNNLMASQTNNQIVKVPTDAKIGSTRPDAIKPNDIVKPDGTVLSGVGYDSNGNPKYSVQKVDPSLVANATSLKVSDQTKDLVRSFEEPLSTVTEGINGKLTVGYGHIVTEEELSSGKFNNPLSGEEMNKLLQEDLER